jgi:hypothetical protein
MSRKFVTSEWFFFSVLIIRYSDERKRRAADV